MSPGYYSYDESHPMTDLITRYQALPRHTAMPDTARILGVSLGVLSREKALAGLTGKSHAADEIERLRKHLEGIDMINLEGKL